MRHMIHVVTAAALLTLAVQSPAFARGFGAARGGYAAGPRGVAYGGARGGVARGPYGGVHAGGARGGTYVGPRGTTVQAGRAGGVGVGPFGGVHAGGAQGVRVTTPGGRTYTQGSAGRAGVGPLGGVHASGARGAAVGGPFGGATVGARGGVRVGPAGGVAAGGARGGVAVGPFGGVAAGGVRGGVAVGPGGVAVGARGVAVGHATRYVSPVGLRTSAGFVRTGFGYRCFTPTWFRAHPAAWVAPRWFGASVWAAPVWTSVSTYCGITAPPIVYDYGSNVVIENNYVYVDGDQVATAEQYADQATQLVDVGREAKPDDSALWQSLGVFGMVQGDEKTAQHIFQLGVNKAGVVRGNYYDAVADNTLPVYGSVQAKSQRVAWSIGDKKTIVFEAGLNNLTQEQTPVLVHYGKEKTQQMVLVRLEEPKDGAK